MNWTWTWSGRCLGYWDGDDLWTHKGKHVGRRRGREIFAPTGIYVGELMSNDRLATNKAKAAQRHMLFQPLSPRDAQQAPDDSAGLSLYTGLDDFPRLEDF